MVDRDAVFRVNVEGTRNVLEAAKNAGARGFVNTSSVTVVVDELERDFRNVDEEWPVGGAGTSYGQSKVCTIYYPSIQFSYYFCWTRTHSRLLLCCFSHDIT